MGANARVLTVFKPLRGRLKRSFAPTGKSKANIVFSNLHLYSFIFHSSRENRLKSHFVCVKIRLSKTAPEKRRPNGERGFYHEIRFYYDHGSCRQGFDCRRFHPDSRCGDFRGLFPHSDVGRRHELCHRPHHSGSHHRAVSLPPFRHLLRPAKRFCSTRLPISDLPAR